MIWKIASKKQTTPLKHLSITNKKITEKMIIINLLANAFSKNSSGQVNTKFMKIEQSSEKK